MAQGDGVCWGVQGGGGVTLGGHLLPNDCHERQYITALIEATAPSRVGFRPRFCIQFLVLSRTYGLGRNARRCCCVTDAGTWPTSNSLKCLRIWTNRLIISGGFLSSPPPPSIFFSYGFIGGLVGGLKWLPSGVSAVSGGSSGRPQRRSPGRNISSSVEKKGRFFGCFFLCFFW